MQQSSEFIEDLIKSAKACHSKHAWDALFAQNHASIATTRSSKLLHELYKLLRADAQSLQYSTSIWSTLLNGCLSCWELKLGVEIAQFSEKLADNSISIPAAKVYLESGFPETARQIAQRAIRRQKLSDPERFQLEMLVCSSYVEQGKRAVALKILHKLEPLIQHSMLSQSEQADFLVFIARTLFLLGRYRDAAKPFAQAAEIFEALESWESAAKALFNAAASLDNAGGDRLTKNSACELVERCRSLSLTHELRGPLAHCEAFYGHNDYWRGNFAGAREHFRKALSYIPSNDRGYRRLHLLSMLAFTYLRTGKFSMAQKFGNETLRLAATEQTDRFATRYENLQAELLWEAGKIDESQNLLLSSLNSLVQPGINILEELAMYSRCLLQASILGQTASIPKINIDDQLRKNRASWSEYLFAKGLCALSEKSFEESENCFTQCVELSEADSDQYHIGYGLLGLIQLAFARREPMSAIEEYFRRLKISAAFMVETPLRVHAHLVEAALEYRRGKFADAVRCIRLASRLAGLGYVENFVISSWLATSEGKAVRLNSEWQRAVLARFTRIYFAPSIEELTPNIFRVSGSYDVDLTRHSALADVVRFLLSSPGFSATPSEIQTMVWKQSLAQLGWRQKIRNTLMRIRQSFPMTMAPLVLHTDRIELYHDAIFARAKFSAGGDSESTVLRLLREGPLSSIQLSNKLAVSSATTKRLLKKLADEEKISTFKCGRSVYYQSLISGESEVSHQTTHLS